MVKNKRHQLVADVVIVMDYQIKNIISNRVTKWNNFCRFTQQLSIFKKLSIKTEPYSLYRDVLLKFKIPDEFEVEEDKLDGGVRGENAYLRHLTMEGAKNAMVKLHQIFKNVWILNYFTISIQVIQVIS